MTTYQIAYMIISICFLISMPISLWYVFREKKEVKSEPGPWKEGLYCETCNKADFRARRWNSLCSYCGNYRKTIVVGRIVDNKVEIKEFIK